MKIEIHESWNSTSQHTVTAYTDNGERIGLLGVVYLPRGRKWATVMERGHSPFKNVIGQAVGIQAGADMLAKRFADGISPISIH